MDDDGIFFMIGTLWDGDDDDDDELDCDEILTTE